VENEVTMWNINHEVNLNPYQLVMRSSNRILKFELSTISSTSRYTGFYRGKEKSKALISDAYDLDKEELKKFRTMVNQSSTRYKVKCKSGAHATCRLPKKVRKSWIALIDDYKKMVRYV
jgi:hypothetical protein